MNIDKVEIHIHKETKMADAFVKAAMHDDPTFEELAEMVQEWAQERGIYEHSTSQAQVLKAVSEMGELADAIIKDDPDGIVDAAGDLLVCLINALTLEGIDIKDCLEVAYVEIKDRKGRMVPGGAFVKEDDPAF